MAQRDRGLAELIDTLRRELNRNQPDYHKIIELTTEGLRDSTLIPPVRTMLRRTLAASHANIGEWTMARNIARTAFEDVAAQMPMDVELLIETAYTLIAIMERSGHGREAAAVWQRAYSMVADRADGSQLLRLAEIRALLPAPAPDAASS